MAANNHIPSNVWAKINVFPGAQNMLMMALGRPHWGDHSKDREPQLKKTFVSSVATLQASLIADMYGISVQHSVFTIKLLL